MNLTPAGRALGLVVDSLAAYRVARAIVDEEAPVIVAAREAIGARLPAPWRGVLECQHCAGLWAALGFGVLRAIPGARLLAYPLAVGGLQSLLVSRVGELQDPTR